MIHHTSSTKSDKPISLILDSGAFSAWSKGAEVDIDAYADFALKYEPDIDLIVNLDVIPGKPGQMGTALSLDDIEASARKGYENYRYMLRRGVPKDKLIHVFHQGESFKWLQRMVQDIPYIGISPANDRTTEQKVMWLDECMKYACDDKGMPLVKFHGFAVTSLRIMMRYPWYSVDSTSWVMTGRMGSIMTPQKKNGGYNWLLEPRKVNVSSRSPAKSDAGEHIDSYPPRIRSEILNYFGERGYSLGRSEFKTVSETYEPKDNERWFGKAKNGKREVEVYVEPGLCNDYKLRDELNIIYFLDLEQAMPAWPVPFRQRGGGMGL